MFLITALLSFGKSSSFQIFAFNKVKREFSQTDRSLKLIFDADHYHYVIFAIKEGRCSRDYLTLV
jgi:hypothetical protein